MEWIVVTARTVEEAKELALDRLGVVEAELEYEVVDAPRAGLFGVIGRSDARIRARVRPISREKPSDRRRRRVKEKRSQKPAPRERASRPAPGGATTEVARKGRRRRDRASANAGGEGDTVEEQDRVSIDEQAEVAGEFARGLVEAFGIRASVRTQVIEDGITVDVEGERLGLLVGPRGATLASFEELVRAAVQRRTGGHSARVNVDVGGYRSRRREALAAFTRGLVEEVVSTGVERALEPMPAADRKVVHDTVAELSGVTTVSEGEEPRRRVVIRRAENPAR